MILAGDIGGTKTNLAFFEVADAGLKKVVGETFRSGQHDSLYAIAEGFLARHHISADVACFGVAGPVKDGVCQAMNLPWRVDVRELEEHLSVPKAFVINDLEATAHGLRALSRSDFITLHRGAGRSHGNLAVIAAGTGLGEAGVFWDGTFFHPFASEGGHGDFSPRNPLESELLEFLMARHGGHVSWERVLSGPGLVNVFRFLEAHGPEKPDPQTLKDMEAGDPAAVITRAGMESRCPVCSRAIDMFIDLYGAEAGNLALKMNALGGVYIAGGVVTHLLPRMTGGAFLRSFFDKGRVRPMLEAMPVHIVTATKAPLLGAAEFARARLPPAAFQGLD